MSSIIDPITGLPYDALDTTLYSIPLDSQPSLAPEWNPQGRISSTVYPDNIPTVFATGQAQNELNPRTVQAMTMDGAGNLNVNVKAGGGGGGVTAPTITPFASGWGQGDAIDNGDIQNLILLADPTKPIWLVAYSINALGVNGTGVYGGDVSLFFVGDSSEPQITIARPSLLYSYDGTTISGIPCVSESLYFNPGLILAPYFPPGSDVYIAAQPAGLIVNAVCGVAQ